MDTNELIFIIGGIGISVIGYFLKMTINELKKSNKEMMEEIKKVDELATTTKGRLEVLEVDYINKVNNLNSRFDMLYNAVRDLTAEIKSLTKELNKKKDI